MSIFVMWLRPHIQFYIVSSNGCSILNLSSISLEKMFKSADDSPI